MNQCVIPQSNESLSEFVENCTLALMTYKAEEEFLTKFPELEIFASRELKKFQIRENYLTYFPIQKLANIFPSRSSLVISPVISPK